MENNIKQTEQKPKEKDGFVVAMGSPHSWNNKCVAVKITEKEVLVQDTKNSHSPILPFSHEEWQIFIDGVKKGEFDL